LKHSEQKGAPPGNTGVFMANGQRLTVAVSCGRLAVSSAAVIE